MNQNLEFRVVVLKEGTELASEVLGYELLGQLAARTANWQEGAVYRDLHRYLVRYPHPEVWREVAATARDAEVFEALLEKRDCMTLSRLASNEYFLKSAKQDQVMKLIGYDASVALEIARYRSYLNESEFVDINEIHEALIALKNYEIDAALAGDSSFKKVVKQMVKHPDPFVAAEAAGILSLGSS